MAEAFGQVGRSPFKKEGRGQEPDRSLMMACLSPKYDYALHIKLKNT
jgi:hypothetical protein